MKIVDIIYRYEARDVSTTPRPSDSDSALRRLEDGNRAFAALFEDRTDQAVDVQCIVPVDSRELGLFPNNAEGPRQHPFAAIVGCSDARVPIELIFNEGPNDLFVIRVAGNSLGTEVLGSLKYAMDHLSESLKLIVVLGHSGCGALTAAVDMFLNPTDYLPLVSKHSLRSILDPLLIVVQACSKKLIGAFGPDIAQQAGYRRALIEASVVTNAALASYSIRQEPVSSDSAELRAVYGVYLLETREVWCPFSERKYTGLAAAPDSSAAFIELGNAIIQSNRIASLIRAKE
jgi:carbonic anhydrase